MCLIYLSIYRFLSLSIYIYIYIYVHTYVSKPESPHTNLTHCCLSPLALQVRLPLCIQFYK